MNRIGHDSVRNGVPHPLEKGGTIFMLKDSWHGFAKSGYEFLLLWAVSPAAPDGFFRDTSTSPGVPPKQLTREQINGIARKYGRISDVKSVATPIWTRSQ